MLQPTLSIRFVLIALGALGILVAAALAGFGLAGINRQFDARKQVAMLELALSNHNAADTFMDDARSDVLRAMLSTGGANKEGEDAVRAESRHHTDALQDLIGENLSLPVAPTLHERFTQIAALVVAFTPVGHDAVELALVDVAAASANFEHFRHEFTGLERLMDETRDDLVAEVQQLRAKAAETGSHVKWMIVTWSAVGVSLMGLVTFVAVRIAARITAALANSREEAHHLALHDRLTGLPNRALLSERLTETLSQARQRGTGLAMVCLDLDRFKQVNDTLGHPIGDALLQEVAGRLRACLRQTDTVARLGGDEFAIIQTPLGSAEEASALGQRIVLALSQAFELHGHRIVVGASVGIALAPLHGTDGASLLRMADTALYRAKSDGRGMHRLFEPEMDEKLQARRALEAELRQAVELQQFELHYQPLIDLASGRVSAIEALIRWRHPERGIMRPDTFIPVAEETGLIGPIGAWVLRQACADAARWPDPVRIAVNVSAFQFAGPGLVEAVLGALQAAQLPPDRLELEITETALLTDAEATLAILRELRSVGVRIAMDDFGTGYSALGYLQSFPFDKIKIDRRFIAGIDSRADCQAIVRAIIGLSCDLGITTTAEGVETVEQLQLIQAEACDQVQGYLFSRPVPRDEITALLARETTAGEPASVVTAERQSRLELV